MDIRTFNDPTTTTAHVVELVCAAAGLAVGAWLLIAPFEVAMDFTADDAATWSTMLAAGAAIVGAGGVLAGVGSRLAAFALMGVSGAWLALAPFVLSFDGGSGSDPAVNSIITGIALVVLAVSGIAARSTEEDN